MHRLWLLVGAVGLSAAAAARADEGGGLSLTNLQARVRVDVEGAAASKELAGALGQTEPGQRREHAG